MFWMHVYEFVGILYGSTRGPARYTHRRNEHCGVPWHLNDSSCISGWTNRTKMPEQQINIYYREFHGELSLEERRESSYSLKCPSGHLENFIAYTGHAQYWQEGELAVCSSWIEPCSNSKGPLTNRIPLTVAGNLEPFFKYFYNTYSPVLSDGIPSHTLELRTPNDSVVLYVMTDYKMNY